MENTEFYDAVMVKSLEHSIDFDFLYTAVLCLKNNLHATADDICREFLKRGEYFYRGVSDGKSAAGPVLIGRTEAKTMLLKGISHYLPAGATILKYHADAYLKIRAVISLLILTFGEKYITTDAAVIIKELCIELILPINYDLPGAN